MRAAVLHRLVAEEAAPVRIGRFALLRRIGSGGTGVVYAAYDPKLDRRVALKLVRDDAGWSRSSAESRFFREAQAMARLSHPNVVAVHDVAVHGTRTYIVLDLVEGEDLRTLLRRTRMPWREVLGLFVQAGQGLAAAHRAGVVHRDFKPANVLVSGYGDPAEPTRVQVTDFGLATEPPPADAFDPETLSSADEEETPHRRRVGTPAYMAPEQQRGESVDARADQFSFCIALFEALIGRRPLQPCDDLWDSNVPSWVRRVLGRGLAPDPAERWPSMEALLEALDAPRRHGGRSIIALTASLAAGAATWALLPAGSSVGCGTEEKHDALVDPARKTRVRDAFVATQTPYAERAWQDAVDGVNAYAGRWSALHAQACVRASGDQAPDVGHLQLACLERRYAEVEGVLDVLEHADALAVERAVAAIRSLAPAQTCLVDSIEDTAVGDNEMRLELARAAGLERAGRYVDARHRTQQVLDRTLRPSVRSEALAQLGRIAARMGHYADAERLLSEATWLAEEHRHEQVAAEATTLAVWVVGARLQRDAEGRLWAEHANAAVARLGDPPLMRAELETNLGVLDRIAGQYASARDRHESALSRRVAVLGPDHPAVATAHKELGNALYEWGETAAAHRHYTRALEIRREALGPDHPDLAVVHNNLGNTSVALGDRSGARAHLTRALDLWAATLPPEHASLGMAHHNLANVLRDDGQIEAAIEHYDAAIEIARGALGSEHTTLGRYHTNVAVARLRLGQLSEAEAALDEADAIWSARAQPLHPDRATLQFVRGQVASAHGRSREALSYFKDAATMRASLFGPAHPSTAEARLAERNLGGSR